MPVHDWARVGPGIFHHFHQRWIGEIADRLNTGLLPADHYALVEPPGEESGLEGPRLPMTEMELYARKQSSLAVRNRADRIVALVEIVSRGQKATRAGLRSFLFRGTESLDQGCHLLIVDLHPPGPHDPKGVYGALWKIIGDDSWVQPADRPLTLVALTAGATTNANVEPVAVGGTLPDMPLFLTEDAYVAVPLEATYQAALHGVPERWRRVLESPGA